MYVSGKTLYIMYMDSIHSMWKYSKSNFLQQEHYCDKIE